MITPKCFKVFSSFLFFSLLLSVSGYSQFFVPFNDYDATRSTAYGEDTIFVFHSDREVKLVNIEHSTRDTSQFIWSRFNPATDTYDTLFVHDSLQFTGVELDSLYNQNLLINAMEALQVEVTTDEDSTEIYRCWVVIDTMPEIGDIRINANECKKLWFELDRFTFKNYTYYRLSDSSYVPQILYNERTVKWDASEDVDIYNPDVLIDFGNVLIGKIGSVSGSFGSSEYIGPYDDSDYYLTIQNSFGNRHRDTIYDVLAKAVKADFEVKKYDNDGNEEDYSEDAINEAMLQIGLVNESENETRYHWKGFNDSLNILDGSSRILWENRQENPSLDSIPKYKPGKYAVRLIVENEYNCIDSLTFYHVSVDSSFIDSTLIPNVFTPNGDGANDVFVLPKKDNLTGNGSRGVISMKRIEVTIMNRNGELVYQYDGHPLDWNGWEGKVKNSNRDASEGIYLYVIKGVGYDGVKHESRHYTGFLYLFR